MTRQNRVLPTGEFVAVAARGTLMGNRGILHDRDGRLGRARWRHKAWIACELCFKGRQRQVMSPGRYTELFFLDEAVALAAGHRPCAECRAAEYRAFLDAWERARGERPRAPEVDRVLHAARLSGREQRRHTAELATLPGGVFVLWDDEPGLWLAPDLLRFTPAGYEPPRDGHGIATDAALRRDPRHAPAMGSAATSVEVLTPAPFVKVLRAGYRPRLHPSAVRPTARPS